MRCPRKLALRTPSQARHRHGEASGTICSTTYCWPPQGGEEATGVGDDDDDDNDDNDDDDDDDDDDDEAS